MQIDIVELSKIGGAAIGIVTFIITMYKIYDKLLDRLAELEKRVTALEKENNSIKKENTLVIYALGACLDGLHQKGCNGKVTEAMERISRHINKAAHDQDD